MTDQERRDAINGNMRSIRTIIDDLFLDDDPRPDAQTYMALCIQLRKLGDQITDLDALVDLLSKQKEHLGGRLEEARTKINAVQVDIRSYGREMRSDPLIAFADGLIAFDRQFFQGKLS